MSFAFELHDIQVIPLSQMVGTLEILIKPHFIVDVIVYIDIIHCALTAANHQLL